MTYRALAAVLGVAFGALLFSGPASAARPEYGSVKNYSDSCAWVTVDGYVVIKWKNFLARNVPPNHQWSFMLPVPLDATSGKVRVQMYQNANCTGPWVRDMYEAVGNRDLDGYFAIRKINGHYQMPRDTGIDQRMPRI